MAIILFFNLCGAKNATPQNSYNSVHEITVKDIDGNEVKLDTFKGKVLVFVNVASKCGLTPQYAEIEAFYEKYKDIGVVVLGFPANNFLWQEPGSNHDVKQFCTLNYGVTFPMFSKISVKGRGMHDLYRYLTQKKQNKVIDAPVKWNFQKFLVDKQGKVVTSFSPTTLVTDPAFIKAVESELNK